MGKILITGATGNVGAEVIRYLYAGRTSHQLVAAVQNPDKARLQLVSFPELEFVTLNFEDPATFGQALKGVDVVFLLRPPHISKVEEVFRPFFTQMVELSLKKVVFLSVQGAEKSRVIPHHRIESLIRELGMNYIFLRPAYFMQNLTTTLLPDIRRHRKIILPANNAKFNWVDVQNIAEVAAHVLDKFDEHKNQVLEITGCENASFETVTEMMNEFVSNKITYESVNPFRFFRIKSAEGLPAGLIVVMILLHYLPRFQKEPEISETYERLTGKKPTTLREFLQREKEILA